MSSVRTRGTEPPMGLAVPVYPHNAHRSARSSSFGNQSPASVNTFLRKYPGLLLGTMAAAGLIKVGALLWQEKFSAWPLLSVLAAPLALAGLAVGIGIGHDRLVSRAKARGLAPVGGLLLLSVPLAALVLGGNADLLVAATMGPIGLALVGVQLGHPETSIGAVWRRGSDSSTEHVEA